MVHCQCEKLSRFEHNEGRDYAESHLVQVAVDEVNWRVLHRCPTTHVFWRESFPRPESHGGGAAVYEKISSEQARSEFSF